jgi:hypothetical protein
MSHVLSGSCLSTLIVQHLLFTAQRYDLFLKSASFSGFILLCRAVRAGFGVVKQQGK